MNQSHVVPVKSVPGVSITLLNDQLGAPDAAILKENKNNLGVYVFMIEKLISQMGSFPCSEVFVSPTLVIKSKHRRAALLNNIFLSVLRRLPVCVCHLLEVPALLLNTAG